MKIFVGNLDFTTGEDELRQLFGQHGQVDRDTIMMDATLALPAVLDSSRWQTARIARKAIAAQNGAQGDSRTLNVNESTSTGKTGRRRWSRS